MNDSMDQHQGSTGFPMSKVAWTFAVGAAVAGLGIALPWEQVTSPYATVSQTPTGSGGAAIVLLAMVAGVVALAWPSREGTLSKGRLVGLLLVVGSMTAMFLAKFAAVAADSTAADAGSAVTNVGGAFGLDLSSVAQVKVEPGFGLYLWTTGVIVLWVGVVRAFRATGQTAGVDVAVPF